VDSLQSLAVTLGFTDRLELLAAALGLANIVLLARRNIWNYPFAIAMVMIYADIFLRAKLYSDALLQIFFLIVNIYGWIVWARSKADTGAVVARALSVRQRISWSLSGAAGIALWGAAMARFTDAALPWWDASIAITSVVAQILLSRRYWENWLLWIAVDVVSIGVYAVKGLRATVLLYLIFLAISIWGYVGWRRSAKP
jgi:nicotinamide mononucleotide transporter